MPLREILRRHPSSFVLLLWMGLMPLIFSLVGGYQGWQHSSWLYGLTFGEWAWFYLLAVFTMALALTPTTFVATLSGAFLGLSSLWYLVPSYMLASLIGYGLAQRIGSGFLDTVTQAYPQSAKVLARLRKSETWLVVLCRISPVLPFAIMNVVLSYGRIRLFPFIAGGLLGMLPRTVLAVMLGMQLEAVAEGNIVAIMWVALLLISIAGLGLIFKKSLQEA